MKKDSKQAAPSKALLASMDSALQWFREKARAEDRRSDAQHYADTQFMIRREMKAMKKAGTAKQKTARRREHVWIESGGWYSCANCHVAAGAPGQTKFCVSSSK